MNWGFWGDLVKVSFQGRTYAQVGGRYFTQHAIERMAPRGFGVAGGTAGVAGRGVPTMVVEDVIANGTVLGQSIVNGALRTTTKLGNVTVVTEQGGKVVVTVIH